MRSASRGLASRNQPGPSAAAVLLPAWILLDQFGRGHQAASLLGATVLLSHAVSGGMAGRGSCGESMAAVG